jgi:hypothetical protein
MQQCQSVGHPAGEPGFEKKEPMRQEKRGSNVTTIVEKEEKEQEYGGILNEVDYT